MFSTRSGASCAERARSWRSSRKVLDLLEFLVRNRDRVVSRDDLLASVWGGQIVSEATLASRINAARRSISDTGEGQRLIRMIIGKGIRFVGKSMNSNTSHLRGRSCLGSRSLCCPLPISRMIWSWSISRMG
jgi:DNA-binding winged helix-turn-helix (wHTH) protein